MSAVSRSRAGRSGRVSYRPDSVTVPIHPQSLQANSPWPSIRAPPQSGQVSDIADSRPASASLTDPSGVGISPVRAWRSPRLSCTFPLPTRSCGEDANQFVVRVQLEAQQRRHQPLSRRPGHLRGRRSLPERRADAHAALVGPLGEPLEVLEDFLVGALLGKRDFLWASSGAAGRRPHPRIRRLGASRPGRRPARATAVHERNRRSLSRLGCQSCGIVVTFANGRTHKGFWGRLNIS